MKKIQNIVIGIDPFRFHTGSIKSSDYFWSEITTKLKFRFHTGSIKRNARGLFTVDPNKFRFHTGSIKSLGTLSPRSKRVCFDSILVRLKVRGHQLEIDNLDACFDSILVRLKVHLQVQPRLSWSRFDSILVRLKVLQQSLLKLSKLRFDSILVRLKVRRRSADHWHRDRFRFHTGSIKRGCLKLLLAPLKSFDSILVRLKVANVAHGATGFNPFRFHTGSIKSETRRNAVHLSK